MNQTPGARLQIIPTIYFGGAGTREGWGGRLQAPARICVLVKTNNPVNNETLVLSPPHYSLLSESDVLLIKN